MIVQSKPVIEINVDPDRQVEDRIDEALHGNFSQYHYDGVERVYLNTKFHKQTLVSKYI